MTESERILLKELQAKWDAEQAEKDKPCVACGLSRRDVRPISEPPPRWPRTIPWRTYRT